MQYSPDGFVFSPSDLNRFVDCEYLSRLDLEVAQGRVLERHRSAEADLLAAKGEAHERSHLERFRAAGKRVVEVRDPGEEFDWTAAAADTLRAMATGADVIYQAVLLEPGWRGRADFLVRVETVSALGGWSYEVWDTKLARHAKPSHVLQLAFYSERVAALQGLQPVWMHVILGTNEESHFRCGDFTAYYRAVRRRFERAVAAGAAVSPYPVPHCSVCDYAQHCADRWYEQDHLSLVAGIRRSQVERLEDAGVFTCADLAATTIVPKGTGHAAIERLRRQAALQTHFRSTGEHRYELLEPTEDNGFHLLPPPSPGDIFFDMEGYPYFEPAGGLEYLFGAVTQQDGREHFIAFRGTDRTTEKRAFEQFVDFVWEGLRRDRNLHVYHYSHYETTALKRLASAHGTREEQIDELLRREVFVDLYQVVRRTVRISHDSYSIKAVRQFFMPEAGQGEVTAGAQSIVEFARWLERGDTSILDAIERYNHEDCVSTLRLRNWLLDRKRECEARFRVDIPFAALPPQREQPVETEAVQNPELRQGLMALHDPAAAALTHLLDYHRREAKPEWWAYFQRRKMSHEQLLEDTNAIAGLEAAAEPPVPRDQSLVYTLRFPAQEFKLRADSDVEAPLGGGRPGTIEWIDASRGRLGLRRGKKRHHEPLPAALIGGRPVPDVAQRRAIERVAEAAVSRESGRYRAVFDILHRRPPRVTGRTGCIQTLDLSDQIQLVRDLDHSYLFIQGPPGCGKTWTGARLIVALLHAGRRVGVTAPSHRAVHNLLEEVEQVAAEKKVRFTGLKKRSTSDETAFEGRFISSVSSNQECEHGDAQLVAGTPWLFAREGLDQAFDVLFLDEAGQIALADAVAVGTSTRNMVLLGDPQQLPHVTQNSHPGTVGCSVLEHLLDSAATIAEDRGVFLAASWRMHPSVCQFVSDLSYESRLVSAPGCERQEIVSSGLTGSGLRFLEVDHRHNAQQSPEEAAVVAAEARRLLRDGRVTGRDGTTRRLVAADILVVAPYNMQVRCLRDALPEGVDVGTVDKFQGREAAVVFFSLASSSGEDVPRGFEFLLNRNRFNVAISRAKCLSVVACSRRLLESRCRNLDQMRLVNALCRFAERSPGYGPRVELAATIPAWEHDGI